MIEKKNFYINGTWVAPKNPKDIQVINPATEKSCAVISLGGKEDINDAVLAAKEAFKTWGYSSKQERDLNYWKTFMCFIKKDGTILLRRLYKICVHQKILLQNFKQELALATQNHLFVI